MRDPSRRPSATPPEAVHRLTIITKDQPEHAIREQQQLAALRSLITAPSERTS